MRRIIPLILLIAVVAAVVFLGGGDDESAANAFRPDRVRHVEELLQNGDPDAARNALTKAQGMNAAEIAYGESVLAFSAGDAEAALSASRRARETAPAAWRPLSIEVAALMALGRDEDVGRAIREALEAAPDDERVLAMAAHHFANSETDRDPKRALALCERIEELPVRKAPEGDSTAVQEQSILVVRYSAAMATGAYRSARVAAQKLTVATNGDPATYVLAGEAARRAGDITDAIDKYRRAVERAPTARLWHEHLVQLLLSAPGGEQEALDRTSTMLRTWPGERSVSVLRARALVRSETLVPDAPDRAVTIYRRLLREDPDDLEVLRNLAVLLYDWKQGGGEGAYLDESYLLLQRYLLRGGRIDATLGSTWRKLQTRAREQAALRTPETSPEHNAFEQSPGDAAAAEAYRGVLVDAGMEKEAGQVVRRALEAAPDDPGVQAFAARHFLAPGPDHDPAATLNHLGHVTQLLGGETKLSESLLWLRCSALLLERRHTEALADAQRLVAFRPSAVPYLLAAAEAALALDRPGDAEAWIREALVIEDSEELRELLERAIGVRDQ